jgi:hypothetical protein
MAAMAKIEIAKPPPINFRMPIWRRISDWLLRKPVYKTFEFTEGLNLEKDKWLYFKNLHDTKTLFEIVIGPGEGPAPHGEVHKGARVEGMSYSSEDGLSVDIAWEESRPLRTGFRKWLLGS